MNILALVLCGWVLVAAPPVASGPDYAALIPILLELAQETAFGEVDAQPPVAIHVGSFVSKINQVADHPLSGRQVRDVVVGTGRAFTDRESPKDCEELLCPWVASERFMVKLERLEETETGVLVELFVTAQSYSYVGFTANITRYEFDWDGTGWTEVSRAVILRS